MIEVADLAWMAGIIDLKGRIIVKKNKMRATPQIVLAVQTQEYAVVKRLGLLVGTTPELMEGRPAPTFVRRGCDEHCPDAHIHVGDERGILVASARWTVTGMGMAIVLTALKPYLQVDRDYDEAIEAITANMVHSGQGVGMVRKQMERMRELGWKIPESFDDLSNALPVRVRARPTQQNFVTAEMVESMILNAMHGVEADMT